MNIDDRLEALAQSVELLASMHKDNEARVAQIMDTMNRMGRILEKHDLDIDEHEDRLNDIDGNPRA